MAKAPAKGKEPKVTPKPKPEAVQAKPEVLQDAEFDEEGEEISSIDDEGGVEEVTVELVKGSLPKKVNDGFKETPGGNEIFEEWRGRIEIDRDEEYGDVIGKSFIAVERLHGRRKITKNHADHLNFSNANTPHMAVTTMYLKPGVGGYGKRINVNNIVPGAFNKKKKRPE